MPHQEDPDERLFMSNGPADHEVRFLIRGLQQLAIDPAAETPPDFHATVMSHAQALPPPRPKLGDRLAVSLTVWAPVLAVGLLLSLGVHVWQGFRALGSRPPNARQTGESRVDALRVVRPLPAYQFQAGLPHAHDLGNIVAVRPVREIPTAVLGFTIQTRRTMFFDIGTLYAEAIAALRGGATEAAVKRLGVLAQVLNRVEAPGVLSEYLRMTLASLHRGHDTGEALAKLLAPFEPLYEYEYTSAQTRAPAALTLMRAGLWLENLALAAAVGDQTAVRQAGQVVDTMRNAFVQLNIPDRILETLEQLHHLVARQGLTDQNIHTIRTLVQDIQQGFSE